jgi:ribosomal protein L29
MAKDKDKKVSDEIIEKSVSDLRGLLEGMKKGFAALRALEIMGQVEKAVEVSPNSIVQVIECIEVQKGFIGWSFRQVWLDKVTQEERDMVVGAYLGEKIGPFKVIGIYTPIDSMSEVRK